MDIFWKAVAAALITAIFCLVLGKQSKEWSVLLTLFVSAMIVVNAMQYLGQVMAFLDRLQELIGIEEELLSILLRSVGISIVGELAQGICTDSGNSSLAKVIRLMTVILVLWMSLPLLEQLLQLVGDVLEGI